MAKIDHRKERLIQVMKKIPIFKGLGPTQASKILALCVHKSFAPGDKVCVSGTPPDEMFVLLSGEVAIINSEGLTVATILPVTMVGEMGVITGLPRVATVEATKPTTTFVIPKKSFDAILRDDDNVRSKVYKAIIDVLSGKLSNDNDRMHDYLQSHSRLEGRIAVLERRLTEQERRAQISLDLGAEVSGRDRAELELHVDEQVKDLLPRILFVSGAGWHTTTDVEAEFRRLVKEGLSGFDVIEASGGSEALDMMGEQKLDLIITVFRMPEMDGIQLLEVLRALYPDLPVLAAFDSMDAEEAAKHAFDGFIEKPLSLESLQHTVETTFGRGRCAAN